MKKIFTITIISILTALALSACGAPADEQKAYIEKLNKERGGVGIEYNYDGPNLNKDAGITPQE